MQYVERSSNCYESADDLQKVLNGSYVLTEPVVGKKARAKVDATQDCAYAKNRHGQVYEKISTEMRSCTIWRTRRASGL